MSLSNKEQSELEYLRGFKKGIEDAMKLVYGEEEMSIGIDVNTEGEDIETIEFKKVTPKELGNILDGLKNKVIGGK